MMTRKQWRAIRRKAKRELRLERMQARHRARMRRIEEGQQLWLRLLLGVVDVVSGEIAPKLPGWSGSGGSADK